MTVKELRAYLFTLNDNLQVECLNEYDENKTGYNKLDETMMEVECNKLYIGRIKND